MLTHKINKLFWILLPSILLGVVTTHAQTVNVLTRKDSVSFRGLSAVSKNIVWVSGTRGTVGRSVDGGNTWQWMTVKGFENADFRDIEAFSETQAIIMAVDAPAYILKTNDGGASWKVVYENKNEGMFLDAMEFWNENSGIVLGDPIQNKFFIGRTFDGGNHWTVLQDPYRPLADSGEACFAASGTNVRKINQQEAVFISGGKRSRLFIKNSVIDIPIVQGTTSTGANSIAIKNSRFFIVAGGDFNKKDDSTQNLAITKNAGKSWASPSIAPHGYRSCIEYFKGKIWITCGLNGVDISNDDGSTWKLIDKKSYHVCRKSKKDNVIFLAGPSKVAKITF